MMRFGQTARARAAFCAIASTLLLAACGGGGGSSPAAEAPPAPATAAAAYIEAGDRVAFSGQTVSLHGFATGITNPQFSWDQISGPKVTLVGADTSAPTFQAPNITSGEALLSFAMRVRGPQGAARAAE